MLRLVKWEINVGSLLFFEGGIEIPDEEERLYQTKFNIEKTRFVYGQVTLHYPLFKESRTVVLEYLYYSPDGQILEKNQSEPLELLAGTSANSHTFRNGVEKFKSWVPGKYRVDILLDGKVIASDSFVIVNSKEDFFNKLQVDSVLLFESEFDDVPEINERVYNTKFMQINTRCIYWEINLSHPKSRKNKPAILEYIVYDPYGGILGKDQFEDVLAKKTTFSSFFMGWGFEGPGRWLCGIFRIEIFLNGILINETDFEIINNGVMVIPTFTVESLNFFEMTNEPIPKEDRVYQTVFSKEDTRYINWELTLTFPMLSKKRRIKIEYVYLRPDRTVFYEKQTHFSLERCSGYFWYDTGCGFENPGKWETGTFTAIIRIDGKIICEGQFKIVD